MRYSAIKRVYIPARRAGVACRLHKNLFPQADLLMFHDDCIAQVAEMLYNDECALRRSK